MGGLKVTSRGFYFMAEALYSMGVKMMFVLEGGYHLDILAEGSCAIVNAVTKQDLPVDSGEGEANEVGKSAIEATINAISKYWKIKQN